eukprot:9416839-Karenia_brevis.AAC.1
MVLARLVQQMMLEIVMKRGEVRDADSTSESGGDDTNSSDSSQDETDSSEGSFSSGASSSSSTGISVVTITSTSDVDGVEGSEDVVPCVVQGFQPEVIDLTSTTLNTPPTPLLASQRTRYEHLHFSLHPNF